MVNLITQTVRDLRKRQTKAEAVLWQALRNRQLDGMKFLRQHPIQFEIDDKKRFFVADFYCHQSRLVVEVDGGVHESQEEYDRLRTQIINILGIRVIRFSNEQVVNNIVQTLNQIREKL